MAEIELVKVGVGFVDPEQLRQEGRDEILREIGNMERSYSMALDAFACPICRHSWRSNEAQQHTPTCLWLRAKQVT